MSDDGLLTNEQLYEITRKKRAHCQHAWFLKTFGVDLPRNNERVIISRDLFENLQAKRAGLLAAPVASDRPKMHLVRKSA
ncbi:protein of unknown function [Noviherbaspirillum humi]|uniref:Uncharacterized protein n=1 Tax=Noviherbaspirillum humi TaxID=1688639 RepID=A0A239LS54_9BURK|nr:DUF4224 domain-containing protein [Noviherbaspirillum humi]SNT33366.1 protein of unknown function [Noviherbaspirillum humi]